MLLLGARVCLSFQNYCLLILPFVLTFFWRSLVLNLAIFCQFYGLPSQFIVEVSDLSYLLVLVFQLLPFADQLSDSTIIDLFWLLNHTFWKTVFQYKVSSVRQLLIANFNTVDIIPAITQRMISTCDFQ